MWSEYELPSSLIQQVRAAAVYSDDVDDDELLQAVMDVEHSMSDDNDDELSDDLLLSTVADAEHV